MNSTHAPLVTCSVGVMATALACILILPGCASEPPPVSPADLRGRTLHYAAEHVAADASRVVQDLSEAYGRKPTTSDDLWGSPNYVVIAACADTADVRQATQVQVGVLRKSDLSSSQVRAAARGELQGDIGCTDGFVR